MPSYALACCKSSTFDLKIGEIRLSITSGDLTFDLTKKVTELISSLILTLFRTPPSPYRYVAQEPS